jgi:serine/threonine protein kinase
MLSPSTILRGRWKIIQKIGQGAFGETYAGYDVVGHEEVAVKVEVNEKKKLVLKLEVAAIRRLQGLNAFSIIPMYICTYIYVYIYGVSLAD